MSGSLNKVTLIGNLGQDPEVRNTTGGKRVVSFSLATSERWTDPASGERVERTEWHRIVVWNEGLGHIAEKFLVKGSKVYVEGALRTRKWQDQSGADRYTTQIELEAYNGTLTFLDKKPSDEQGNGRAPARAGAAAGGSTGAGFRGGDMDDEIPFGPSWQ